MLAHRVIPSLLCRGRQLVKGTAFDSWRSVGVAAQAVRIHQARGVDELVLLDIGATPDGRGPDLGLIEELSAACFMPLAVGGGIRSVEDARALLMAGADKIVVCTGAVERPALIQELSGEFGCQAVVVSIDVKAGSVWSRCGKSDAGLSAVEWAQQAEALGAGEILLTSVEREGTLQGYDLDLIGSVAEVVGLPLIAAGGAGHYGHLLDAIEYGADAVSAGAMFQFTDATPRGAAGFLQSHGVLARVA